MYHYALTSIWCCDWEWVELQPYFAVSRMSATADTLQTLTNSADPSLHIHLNPHNSKAQLAVTLKHGISANKKLTCLHCKDFIKNRYILLSVGLIMWEIKKYCLESRSRGISYMKYVKGRRTGLVTFCVETAFYNGLLKERYKGG